MKKEDREFFMKWASTNQYKNLKHKTIKEAGEHLSYYNKPYIAFSGGKDSIVQTHILLSLDEGIKVYHHEARGKIPSTIREEIREILTSLNACNLDFVVMNSARGGWGHIQRKYVGVYDCCFVGLRKEEGVGRKMRMIEGEWLTDIPEIYILQDWSYKDVWAYIVENQLKYPRLYDLYSQIISISEVRFHSFFDDNRFGGVNLDKFSFWRLENAG